jgi:hypothetical protein
MYFFAFMCQAFSAENLLWHLASVRVVRSVSSSRQENAEHSHENVDAAGDRLGKV